VCFLRLSDFVLPQRPACTSEQNQRQSFGAVFSFDRVLSLLFISICFIFSVYMYSICIVYVYICVCVVFFKAYIWDIWGVNVARYSILEHCSIWDPFVGVVAILSPTISVTNKNSQCMNVHRKIIWTFALKYLKIADFLSTSWNVHNCHLGELRTSLHYPCVDHDLLWIGPHWDITNRPLFCLFFSEFSKLFFWGFIMSISNFMSSTCMFLVFSSNYISSN